MCMNQIHAMPLDISAQPEQYGCRIPLFQIADPCSLHVGLIRPLAGIQQTTEITGDPPLC